ncbi:LuxR C-terminal-related transcriptional regulator [Paenibacillus xylanexedens]|uniref:LuxR C-terminal-related transcriptional regulator n=1 Tax=Paenibacillus xylanexedens TaxID=528191 RepID=UPI00119DCFB9|nr:AAA family ATPase [Paenibacillus xylanexedens]
MFIELSIILAEMVHREHEQNRIIGYLSPDHISVQLEGRTAHITWHTESHAAYHSPEQLGRFNLVPSERSDLYALGVILYELLTGQLPFRADNDEDWGIVHIRKLPLPLSDIRPGLDETLQAILMKLLAKSQVERYQSTYGLLEDLKLYENRINNDVAFPPLEVGRLDQIRTLSISDSWYGRSAEVSRMEAGLEQVFQGMNAFRWVIGKEGAGKTALVHRIQQNVVRLGGRMIAVQTEPSPKKMRCAPILQALVEWIFQLWSEPVELITSLKAKLQAEFGSEVQVIVSCLPEAELLFDNAMKGSHISDAAKVWDRFEELLPDLICCMAECKPPLVLFVDNLQWVDNGTQKVIRELVLTQKFHGLFLIGAYRTEEEVTSTGEEGNVEQEELLAWLTYRCCANPEEQVTLPPLAYEDVRRLVSDALYDQSARIQLLTRSVYDRTGGNPGSVRLLLEEWLKENRLYFDERRHQWVWDSEITRQLSRSEEHLRMLEMSFSGLTEDRKEFLAMAAAIGPIFQLTLLAEACGRSVDSAFHILQEAEAEGYIYREDKTELVDEQDLIYVFAHESIHRMVYAFDSGRNTHRHQVIGRLLQDRTSEPYENLSRTAIDHLNLAASVLSDEETKQLIEHNLQAAQEALASASYAKGKQYAENGLHLLATCKVHVPDSLVVGLRLVLAWTEYMSGNSARAKELLVDLNQDSDQLSRSERLKIWAPLIQFHAFADNETAVQFGMEALSSYGWKLEKKSTLLSIGKEVTQTAILLHRKRDKRLLLSNPLDEDYEALCHIMELLLLPLLVHDARALLELYARFIRYGLRKGVNESLAAMIGAYELIVQRTFPSFVRVTPIAERVFLQMANTSTFRKKHVFTFLSGMIKQSDSPLESSVVLFNAMREGMEAGDHDFANAALIFIVMCNHGNLCALNDLLRYFEENMQQVADDKILEMMRLTSSYAAVLQDESLIDSFIAIPQVPTDNELEPQDEDNYSCGCRLEVAYLSGRYREALYWSKRGRINELHLDWMRIRKQRVYETLALSGLYFESNREERKRIRKAIRAQLRLMKSWRGYLDSTSSAYLLIHAEGERIAGNSIGAMQQYTAAIRQARTEKYVLLEAIACERLAVYYQDDLLSRSGAAIMMMDACAAYAEWGISFKLTQIRSGHAELLDPVYKRYEGPVLQERVQMTRSDTSFPQQNGSKTGEGMKSEEEPKLIQRLIHGLAQPKEVDWKVNLLETAIRQAGAERGLLLKHQNNEFCIEVNSSEWTDKEKGAGLYAVSVLRHTTKTAKPLILYDALQSFWVKDAYIAARKQRSILCMSIDVPGEPISYLLYLENRHMPGVFTMRDVQMLELIATRIIYLKLLEEEAANTTIPNASESNASSVPSSLGQPRLTEALTERETEIITAIAKGLSNREIADCFGIAETTVKTHTSRIYGKLGVKRRGQAVLHARELNLIE